MIFYFKFNITINILIYVTNTSGLTVSLIDPVTDTLNRNISTTVSAGAQDPLGEIVTVAPVK